MITASINIEAKDPQALHLALVEAALAIKAGERYGADVVSITDGEIACYAFIAVTEEPNKPSWWAPATELRAV